MTTMYRSRSGTKSELAGVSVSLPLGNMMRTGMWGIEEDQCCLASADVCVCVCVCVCVATWRYRIPLVAAAPKICFTCRGAGRQIPDRA